MMAQGEMEEVECRKLLLDFYSSQLTSHARLITGVAIILFTIVQVKLGLLSAFSIIQSGIFYSGVLIFAFPLWYLFMRHLTYGMLANAATHANPLGEGTVLRRIMTGVREHVLENEILGVVPSHWFLPLGGERLWSDRSRGLLLCVILSLCTTIPLWVLMQ